MRASRFTRNGGGGASPVISLRMAEVVQVVAATAAEGEHEGKGLPAPAGTPHPLLIVEALRRHVGLQHRFQWADVDPHLHGGGHRQHLDAVGLQRVASLLLQADAAKLPLPACRDPPSGR